MAKVLVIDDSRTQAMIIAQLLFRYEHVVEIETSGEQGLIQALQQEFDLIISDLNLPDLSGLEICRRYKASGRGGATLLVSSEDQLNLLHPEFNSGIDYYCTKDLVALEMRIRMIFLQQQHKRLVQHR